MKKQLLLFVFMLLTLPINAAIEIDGIFYWLFSDTQTATVTYSGNDRYYWGDVVIPSTVTYEGIDYSVTTIGWDAFGSSRLKSITIPNTIKNIQSRFSFQNSSLASVHISDLKAWCEINFNNNSLYNPLYEAHHLYLNDEEIKDLIIPNNVASIENYAFSNCEGLTSVTIPNCVTSIGDCTFQSCTGLTSVIIDNGLTSIGRYAFSYCANLTSIDIPNSVTSIGGGAFEGTAWYNNQPDGLVYAGKNAYKYKGTMPDNTSIIIEDGTLSIVDKAFYTEYLSCTGLISITIPNSVMTIGASAFQSCKNLTSIIIPNSVISIGSSAFSNCSGLTSITIPNSISKIEYSTFENCSSLTSINIPNSVISIGNRAFNGCTGLTSITIPNSITSIEARAFDGCSSLTSMTFLCEIVDYWFDGNISSNLPPLTDIIFGEGVKTIKDNAFNGFANIKTIDIASTVTSIGAKAFSGTNKLSDVICRAIDVPEMDRTAFENSYPNYATLHVPAVSIAAYKATAPWNEFKEIVALKQDLPDDAEQCATPTITYQNGKLLFASETEGVEFNYVITDNDIKAGANTEVQLDATYHISVYATKEGYKDSETATATLCWIDANPTTEGITQGIASVSANAVLIRSNNGILSITGAQEGTPINVYDISGKTTGSAKASDETTNVATSLQRGDIGIVMIGGKSIKLMMK